MKLPVGDIEVSDQSMSAAGSPATTELLSKSG